MEVRGGRQQGSCGCRSREAQKRWDGGGTSASPPPPVASRNSLARSPIPSKSGRNAPQIEKGFQEYDQIDEFQGHVAD
jgi:hypothetical protein